ncbi:MAG TPA: hypothetical protein VK506_09310, partial [Conexibacter sp.]|nr:hypothetical protein [Conexibacter sp.]
MSIVAASREAQREAELARLSKAERKEVERMEADAAAAAPQGEAMFRVKSLIGRDAGQEIRLPYHAASNALQSGFATRIPGEIYPPDFPGAPKVMTTESTDGAPAITPEAAAEEVSGTVADATEHVAAAETIEALDAIEGAEKDGKDRKGVLDAI